MYWSCSRAICCNSRAPELLRLDDAFTCSRSPNKLNTAAKSDSCIPRVIACPEGQYRNLAGFPRERFSRGILGDGCRSHRLTQYGEGAGSKPLSVHLSAGRIQLCILPGPADAIRTCLDLLRRGCPFQPRSGNLPLPGSSYPWHGSFLLQSRPSRTPAL